MRSPQQRRNRQYVSNLPAVRDLSPEGKHFTATHPALYLHVYCNFSGVHCHAHVDWLTKDGRLHREEVARATWRPSQVSERLIVEWGQRALSRWLESHPVAEGDAEPGAS